MQRTFIFNLMLIIFLNLIIKPFYIFGIDAEVQNQVGTSEYGLYFSLLNLTFLFNILLDFGIANYTSRTIAQHPKLISSYFSKLFSIKLILFFLYAAVIMIVAFFLNYESFSIKILLLLILNQFLISIIQFIRSNLTGLHLFKLEAFLSVFDRVLLILICSLLLWTDILHSEFTIHTFVFAQMAAYGIAAVVSLLIITRKTESFKIQINKQHTILLLKQSAPYAILIFLMFIYNRIDAIMLERMLDNGKFYAGIYAQGFRYLDAVNMIPLLFAGLLLPIYSRLIGTKKSVYAMVETPFKLLIPSSILVAITGFFFAPTIMSWRYIEHSDLSAIPFSILILSFIPISATYIYGTLLTANGNLKALNYMAAFGVALNLLLNVILIPKFKAEGAAFATLITQFVTAAIQIILAYRLFKFKVDYGLLFSTLVFALFIFILNSEWFIELTGLKWFERSYQLLLYLFIGSILIFIFRFIKIPDLISLLKKNT